MKKLLLVIALAATGGVSCVRQDTTAKSTIQSKSSSGDRVGSGTSHEQSQKPVHTEPSPGIRIGSEASNTQIQGSGIVSRILSDDNDGSRHQRFILRLQSGQTLLIAHNIDLAPRVDNLKEGDTVEYSGEYEQNPKGGVVHWTHRDPSGRHAAGWLKHGGQVYQ